MRFAAETLRHKALRLPWTVPAFGEEAGVWRSHDKKQAKSAHNKGAVGRLVAIDPWENGTSILTSKDPDVQDPELAHGLQPKTVAVDCLRLSKPRMTSEGWNQTPEGKDLWLRMQDGHTQCFTVSSRS